MNHPIALAALTFLALMMVMTWAGYRVFFKPGRFLRQLGNPVIGADHLRPEIDLRLASAYDLPRPPG